MQRKVLVVVVALSVAFGVAAVAATDSATVEVEQEPNEPAVVTVTNSSGDPVENASLTVELADGDQPDYGGTGGYTTDANGTVKLPTPEETVDVIVAGTVDNETVTTEATLEYHPELDLTVEQATGQPATVTVAADNESAENTTVSVETVGANTTYEGTGNYTTDANGTVRLPAPNETVNVTVSTEYQGASATTEAELRAAPDLNVSVEQDGPGLPATVTVLADSEPTEDVTVDVGLNGTENATYAGTGTYETDANGTVGLPAPEETVTVTVTAGYQGAETGIVVAVEGIDAIDESLPFGQQLQQFKATLDDDNRTGREIASWVTENNPGNAPDHAGPKGPSEDENATGGSNERGPPAHANDDGDDGSEDTGTESDGNGSDGRNSDSNAGGNGKGNSGANGPPGSNGNR